MKPWEKYAAPAQPEEQPPGPWAKYAAEPVQREITAPQESRRSWPQQVAGYWTKDIPEAVTGAAARTGARFQNIMKPTALGAAAVEKTGATGLPAQAVEAVAGTPERIGRTAGAVAGTVVGEPLTVAQELGGKAVKNITGGKVDLSKIASMLSKPFAGSIADLSKWWESLPEAERANYSSAIDLSTLLGMKAGKAAPAVGKSIQGTAGRIQGTKVKILSPEFKKGASNKMYTKYGVFGNAQQVAQQWKGKISDTASQLKQKIKSVEFDRSDPSTRINIAHVLARAKKRAMEGTRINKNAIANIADNVTDELGTTYNIDFKHAPAVANNIDLAEAQLLKQEVGKHGDWLSFNGKLTANQDATNKAAFYNTLYDELKVELQNKGGPEIAELNRQLSEMIPMERAASKQVLTANRKNPISLDDYIGGLAVASSAMHGNLLPAAMAGLNVATKSPTVAKGLYGVGKTLKKPGLEDVFSTMTTAAPADISRAVYNR
jgi:hypothetical protein